MAAAAVGAGGFGVAKGEEKEEGGGDLWADMRIYPYIYIYIYTYPPDIPIYIYIYIYPYIWVDMRIGPLGPRAGTRTAAAGPGRHRPGLRPDDSDCGLK